MANRTPGEWKVRFHPSGDPEEFIVQAERQPGQAVAQTIMEHSFYPTKLGDAHIVAAAPEMLDLLQNLLLDPERIAGFRGTNGTWLDRARAAVAKAEGRHE